MYSVVILTLNEERALPECLASVGDCDDIVIVDSGSTDGTADIARKAGARIVTRPFDTFSGQRNFADRSVAYKHPWVFHLDADERMTKELSEECKAVSARDDLDGFRVAPKMTFRGRWLPHCTDYPAFQARFVRPLSFDFIQVGHGQREAATMRVENLRENYLHDMSIYGTDAWLDKHRRYARAEASALLASGGSSSLAGLFSKDPLRRRRALKRAARVLPMRAQLRFFYQYVLRRGFLDGGPGLEYCRLLATYEGYIGAEIAKLKAGGAADSH